MDYIVSFNIGDSDSDYVILELDYSVKYIDSIRSEICKDISIDKFKDFRKTVIRSSDCYYTLTDEEIKNYNGFTNDNYVYVNVRNFENHINQYVTHFYRYCGGEVTLNSKIEIEKLFNTWKTVGYPKILDLKQINYKPIEPEPKLEPIMETYNNPLTKLFNFIRKHLTIKK